MAVLIDRFVLQPAHCAICRWAGSSNERAIFDTNANVMERLIDNVLVEDGRLYLCSECVTEMATMLRFVPPEMADTFVAERDAALARVKDLELEVATLSAFKELAEAYRPAPDAPLRATPRNTCPDCGEPFQNRGVLARHREAKHGAPHAAVRRGDEALQPVEVTT